ncbi:lipocalin family protein [Microbacterium sp. YY-03]|uniref:lipocalin family protein n=1 Tax=Microbacterium sp. YY-03 TaxID=3421636 RepID=UPI003D16EF50
MTDVVSLPALDLERYLGPWFEIARLPMRWEDDKATCVTAHYTMNDDGTVRVDNRCYDEDGKPVQSIGRAKPVEGEPAQLRVSFMPELLRWMPFTEGDYWVLKIDENYKHALVGTPDHKNLWLLARTSTIDPEIEREFLDHATAQGFDLAPLIRPRQDGRSVSSDELEES